MNFKSTDGYFTSKSYPGYIFGKIKRGEPWSIISSLYKSVKKYTLFTAIVRTVTVIVTLLEKSALLLLLATFLLLLLPAVLSVAALFSAACITKYFLWHKRMRAWLSEAKKITVYLSSEKIFVKNPPLFLRCAAEEAGEYDHPVLVLCKDAFASVRWYSFNLLAIKPDYFFLLKRLFFATSEAKITYIALS